QPFELELGELVADGRGRDRERPALDQALRSHRSAGGDVLLHDAAQDLLLARGQADCVRPHLQEFYASSSAVTPPPSRRPRRGSASAGPPSRRTRRTSPSRTRRSRASWSTAPRTVSSRRGSSSRSPSMSRSWVRIRPLSISTALDGGAPDASAVMYSASRGV